MPRSRTFALLGSTILFAAVSTAVFLAPSHAPYLFFAFTLVSVSAFQVSPESSTTSAP